MRTTGREDFVLPPSRGDPEDGVDDVGIRDQDTGEGDHPREGCFCKHYELKDMSV